MTLHKLRSQTKIKKHTLGSCNDKISIDYRKGSIKYRKSINNVEVKGNGGSRALSRKTAFCHADCVQTWFTSIALFLLTAYVISYTL